MVEKGNLLRACQKVVSNNGSPGIDGMKARELPGWLQRNFERLIESLQSGTFKPSPVRLVEIEKPGGGKRGLGVPTVVDRMIQQAIHQVLSPIFDPGFSDNSYGFRLSRDARQAVLKAQHYQRDGKRWVVDVDLSKFFDEVNHDVLMALLKRKVRDGKLLKLIDLYLKAGIMHGGLMSPRQKGTPQGSPLSPLLSNIILDVWDKELEKRGHEFCRYADDCVTFVSSRKAGERVFSSITKFLEKRLKLQINYSKSNVKHSSKLTFLGYGFTADRNAKLRVPADVQKRFKRNAKQLFRRGRGMNLRKFIYEYLNPYVRGWINYYKHCNVKGFAESLDGWIRRRLRLIIWRQWKRPYTRYKYFVRAGFTRGHAWDCALNRRGPWWNSGSQHMNFLFPAKFFANLGLISMLSVITNR